MAGGGGEVGAIEAVVSPGPAGCVAGLGAKKCDQPMKITAERIRNKISLFSI
jgi:hypothetical protein